MSREDILSELGITLRVVSEHTTVVEYKDHNCRPATDLEIRMYSLLTRLTTR